MRHCFAVCFSLFCLLVGHCRLAAQNLQVNSAVPSQAAQGTINLDVAIGGNGFKQGAKAQWFVSGTTDPGGVTVNSTAFVSSTQLTANITVSSTASIASFDIAVTNKNGSSGKGTGLFSVNANGNQNQACTLQPLPPAFTQLGVLNYVNSSGTAQYSGSFGLSVRVTPITLGGKNVLLTAVGSGAAQMLDVFFVDPVTGGVLDGTAIGVNTQIQPHIAKSIATKPSQMLIGDFNGDAVPDIVVGYSAGNGQAYAFLGSVDSTTGVLTYSNAITIAPPTANSNFGSGFASADLNGDGRDELIVGASGTTPNQVFLFNFDTTTSSFNAYQTLNDPAPFHAKSGFGLSVALGDITGTSDLDLIVGSDNQNNSVYVYPGPGFTSSLVISVAGKVGAGNVDGGSFWDLLAAQGGGGSIFSGPVYAGEAAAFTIAPISGVPGIFALHDLAVGDINSDGLADIIVGAPYNTGSSKCPAGGGSVYVFLTNPATPDQPVRYLLQPPRIGRNYGESVAVAPPPYNLVIVGENGGDVVTGDQAGQVWIYKVN